MSEETSYEVDFNGYSPEEFLEIAEDTAHQRGYTIDDTDRHSINFSSALAEYEVEVDENESKAELKGRSSGALGAYKSLLESNL